MGLFSRKPPRPSAASAPEPEASVPTTETTGPLVVNTLVQTALLKWGAKKNAQTMNEVLRQCVAGELLIDVSGSQFADISEGLQPGDTLGVGQIIDNAGKRLLLVFTSNDALRAYRPEVAPMSLAQPAAGVMQQALSGYEGVVIDPASSSSCIIYNTEIQLGVSQEPGINQALKTALVENRPHDQIRELAASAPLLFIGVKETRSEAGEIIGAALPTVQTTAGETCALAFTSPAEVWAFDATLSARPTGLDDVIDRARSNGHDAVMLDPMGPWAMLRVRDFDAT
jgi:hypothetical protein